jgi:DNA-binding CsgD family transcriptional regulator
MHNHLIYQQLAGISAIYEHIEHVLECTPTSTYWKDKKGRYLGVNSVFVRNAAEESSNDIVGYTDRDLVWGDKESAFMQKNDKEVMYTGCPKTIVESAYCLHDKKMRLFLSHKKPLYARTGKTIGVFGVSFLLDGKHTTSTAIENAGFPSEFVILNNSQLQLESISTIKLTDRQLDCLFYLVKGMSIKLIAKTISLSPRTVEHYLDTVKTKLKCESRVALIEKALKMKMIQNKLFD